MYIAFRRRKVGKINEARAALAQLEFDLRAYDAALEERGITVVPCDICNNMNWVCDDCGILTCKDKCPRCGETTDWTVKNAVSC